MKDRNVLATWLLLLVVALVWALPALAVEAAAPAAVSEPQPQAPPPAPQLLAVEPAPVELVPPLPAVGVVLPLSGRYGAFGELVRRGLELALERPGGAPARLLFRDAGTEPEQNARAVAELAADPAVLVVVGPLTSAAAAAAAAQAQSDGVPLLTLSQRAGLPEAGDYVFRTSLTSRQQVPPLVDYAMRAQRLKAFAVLHPETKQGRELAELFGREVEKRGGRVAARQGYAETDTDFRRPIRFLQGGNPDASDEEPGGAMSPPTFQALFIPDDAERVALIAPQLAYYGLGGIPLLGTSGWNAPELVLRAGRFVEGAVFVDGFFPGSPLPQVRDFVARYVARYGEEPSILEAQGYDAAGILLTLLARPEVRTRADVRQALAGLRLYPGVTGATSFNPEGDAEKVLFLLQVRSGEIVQINP